MTETTLLKDNDINTASRALIDELIAAISNGNDQQRTRMLERVTDLFVAGARGYSGEQVDLFDDVLRQLASDIEVKVRAQLAERLARIENAPRKLIRSLAFDDEIAVARPVLVHSTQLTDSDLVENAATKSQEHLLAISVRLVLSEAVTDVLVQRGDDRVAHKVATNKGARFSLAGYDKLTIRASRDEELRETLGQRSDVPRQYFLKLLEGASATVRAKLEAAHPELTPAIRDTVDEVATEMQRETREISRSYSNALRNGKRRFRADRVTEANVHGPARAQEFERTVVALTRLGNLPIDLVERALVDQGEDLILIIAKAAGCSWTTTRELLLMYVAGRQLELDDLSQTFKRYSKLSQETARQAIAYYVSRIKLRDLKEAEANKFTARNAKDERTTGPAAQAKPMLPRGSQPSDPDPEDSVSVKIPA